MTAKQNNKIFTKITKKIFGFLTGAMCIGGIISTFRFTSETPHPVVAISIIIIIILGFLTFLLFKPNKKIVNPKKIFHESENKISLKQFPKETLDAMRSVAFSLHSENYFKIVKESIKIMNETGNIETLLSRYNVALRNAYTLKQMEQANILGGNLNMDYCIHNIITHHDEWIINCYNRFIMGVKTDKGKAARKKKFIEILEKHLDEYELNDLCELLK